MRWSRIVSGVASAVTAGVVSATAYLVIFWLPRANPSVFEWPQMLTIAAPPIAVAALMRWPSPAIRIALAAGGTAVGFASALLGAVTWFVVTSN